MTGLLCPPGLLWWQHQFENCLVSIPAVLSALGIEVTSLSLVRNDLSLNTYKGPLITWQTAMYANTTDTGHKSACVLPR